MSEEMKEHLRRIKKGIPSKRKGIPNESNSGTKHWNWKGGRSEVWYRKLLQENNIPQICKFCGIEATEVHHLNKNHHDNKLENLVWACKACHVKQHDHVSWNKGKKGLQIAWNKGKTGIYSEETRKKMGKAKLGHVPWWIKKGFNSCKEAAKTL